MLRIFLTTFALICVSAVQPAGAQAPQATTELSSDQAKFEALLQSADNSMLRDPARALATAREAEALAEKLGGQKHAREALARTLWLQAEAQLRLGEVDEARAPIDRAMQLVMTDGVDTKLDGDLQLSLARFASLTGDVSLALKSYHAAHDIFAKLGEVRSQSMALQGLGSIYDEARDFEREIEYYRKARSVYSGDPSMNLSAANNLADAYKQLGRYDEAIEGFGEALAIARELKTPLLEARILTNLASVQAKKGDLAAAEKAADEALALLGGGSDKEWSRFAWGVKAEIAYRRGQMLDASRDLARTFDGVDVTTTTAPFRDMHEIAYKVYLAFGNHEVALEHLEAFKRLDDEGRELSANANLALMAAQFDFATQQLEIEHLKTEQLKRDFTLAKSRADVQRMMLTSVTLISLLTMGWIGWNYISVRQHRNAINRANVKLLSTVAEREEEIVRRKKTEEDLRLAKEDAERASHAKSQFLANMSHELRTPLNAIIGFAEIMEAEMMGPIGMPAYKGYSTDIVSSGRHLLSILNEILDMARIDAGKAKLDEREFDLCASVKDTLRMFSEDARLHDKTVRLTTRETSLKLFADERLVRQIVINLVSNAIKFTGEGGLIEARIERTPDGGCDLVVSDNGMGIPEDKIGEVMEPFGQAADAFSRAQGGVGLGLPIVKALAELHGGKFTLSSVLGMGTTARVSLPVTRVMKDSLPAERPKAAAV